ncbi:MAG: DUF1501 domain-containing protein [Pirellulales bacterium]
MHNAIRPTHRCDGIHRRDSLRIGALTGLGLALPQYFGARLAAASLSEARAKSCILLWLDGGPSHLETFDVKPEAPAEVRGPFRPIATNVSGIEVCELMPATARITDKLAIVRSLTSPLGEHGLANQYLLSGYKPSSVLQYPSFGSVVSSQRQSPSVLPPYVTIPESRFAGAGYLGSRHEPFATGGDPSQPSFRVRDLDFFPEVDEARLTRRRAYLREFDRVQAAFESDVNTETESTAETGGSAQFEQAYRLVTSPAAKTAFDLAAEPEAIRNKYGSRMFGQSCLLARRLVERGVPFVTVMNSGWDTHDNLVLQLKEGYAGAKVGVGLIPAFDQGFAALIGDLSERGMLDETLVIAMGEFGRTPKLNARGGRDHWPRVFSIVLAGGGVPGGQVIGASDRIGESPADSPITPNDLARTIYTILGVDPDLELRTPDGRPVRVNQGGERVERLM